MSRLDELITELCPNGVERKPLADCCNILDRFRKPITKAARNAGEYPYYGANGIQDYVSDYIFDGTYVLVGEDGSVITPNGNPVVNWAEGKIWVNNHAHIVEGKEGIMLRFLFHYLHTVNVSPLIHGNIPKLTGGDFKALSIPVPPVEVQREIVRILDSFTDLDAKLQAELQARKKQYEYYRDSLFVDITMPIMQLNTIASIFDGTHQTPEYKSEGIPFISVENIGDIYHSTKYISHDAYDKYKIKPQKDDVFMTRIGTIGKCSVLTYEADIAYYVSLALIRPNKNIVRGKYLKYVIESNLGAKELYKRTLINAVPIKINKEDIGKIEIPVPSLKKQDEIIAILDHFETLCTNSSCGLPAEIDARQKQYEYYRNKLLFFREATI